MASKVSETCKKTYDLLNRHIHTVSSQLFMMPNIKHCFYY